MIEQEKQLIDLPKGDEDRKYFNDMVVDYFNLEMEIDSAKESQKGIVDRALDFYKLKVNEDTKKGDVGALIKAFVAELKENKISEDVEKKENFLALLDTVRKDIKV